MSKTSASKLYLNTKSLFLEYLKLILHESRAGVTLLLYCTDLQLIPFLSACCEAAIGNLGCQRHG